MEFKIWITLTEDTKEIQDMNLPQYVTNFIGSRIDNENIYTADVLIDNIEQIQDLGYYFNEDISIFGDGMNDIAPISTLKELGLC